MKQQHASAGANSTPHELLRSIRQLKAADLQGLSDICLEKRERVQLMEGISRRQTRSATHKRIRQVTEHGVTLLQRFLTDRVQVVL